MDNLKELNKEILVTIPVNEDHKKYLEEKASSGKYSCVFRYIPGKEVTKEDVGTLNQSFARVHIICDSKEHLFDVVEKLYKTLKVVDDSGNDMVIRTFDFDEMREEKRWIRR